MSVCLGALLQPATDRPVGRINACSTDAIAAFFQKGTHAVTLLRRVAFFEIRIAE